MTKTGILLTNTGTPEAPTRRAVRRYLREFLSDPHVIKLPRLVWLPILYGLVLPLRSSRSAKLYQKIWTADGSPMRINMQKIATAVEQQLTTLQHTYHVCVGMNYGTPSIDSALQTLHDYGVDDLIIVPMFPQFSTTTTLSSINKMISVHKTYQQRTPFKLIDNYAKNSDYINGLAKNVRDHWASQGRAHHLLISFHGVPEKYILDGDPYQKQCEHTAHLLAQALQLEDFQWTLCYQSRFGYNRWLTPATQDLFKVFPKKGITEIDIVCPGFAVDCLETLEEVAIRGREMFLEAGGKALRYISALNDSTTQVDLLARLITSSIAAPMFDLKINNNIY